MCDFRVEHSFPLVTIMDNFYQLENYYISKWKCRKIILKPKAETADPIRALHDVILHYIDRHYLPNHTVVHLILTQNNGTVGFSLTKMNNREVITVKDVKSYQFMERELGGLARKILNSNENWVLDSGARFTMQFYLVPKDILEKYTRTSLPNKRKWEEEAEADRTGYDSSDDESEIDV